MTVAGASSRRRPLRFPAKPRQRVALYRYTGTLPPVFERLDPRSPTPLYEQIAARLRVAIAAEEIAAGDALPSVRSLSAELRVNPATVVQAYRELEGDGLVESRQGAGTFVRALHDDRRRRDRMVEAKRLVRALLADAGRVGLSPSELREAILRWAYRITGCLEL